MSIFKLGTFRRYSLNFSLVRLLFSEASIGETNTLRKDISKAEEILLTSHEKRKVKSLNIAILGLPNVGKSTLINQLINRPICAASSKVHTTQAKARAIYSEDDTQLVFLDTPGLVTSKEFKKYKLKTTFKEDPKSCLEIADVVGVVQDASNVYTRDHIDKHVLELCRQVHQSNKCLLLILNKVDRLKNKSVLLRLVRRLTSIDKTITFTDVFMISALKRDGVDDLRNYLLESAKEKDWQYTEDTFTDQSPEKLIEETVRAKLLDSLPQELPYKLQVVMEHFEVSPDGSITSIVLIKCPTNRIFNLVIGYKGSRIKQIALDCEQILRHAFHTSVVLKLRLQSLAETKQPDAH